MELGECFCTFLRYVNHKLSFIVNSTIYYCFTRVAGGRHRKDFVAQFYLCSR